MSSPITSADFQNQSTGASLCEQFQEKLLNNGKLRELLDYLFTADGLPSTNLINDLVVPFMAPVGQTIWCPVALMTPEPANGAQWVPLTGQTLPTSSYPKLASYLGATDQTFTVPDLRGKFLAGRGANGVSENTAGGEATVELSQAEMPRHTHSYMRFGAVVNMPGLGTQTAMGVDNVAATTGETGGVDGEEADTGAGHNNMPPYHGGLFYILAGYKVSQAWV